MKKITLDNSVYFNDTMKIDNINVPDSMCARYCRLKALELFLKQYNMAHAWNFHHANEVVGPYGEKKSEIKPGDVVLSYCERSDFKDEVVDFFGDPVDFTHASLYLGEDNVDGKTFIHQFKDRQYLFLEEEFEYFTLEPKLIVIGTDYK